MANDNFPRGLFPLNFIPKEHARYYKVSTATDIYLGQPVVLDSTGYVVAAVSTGVIQMLGVAVGFAGPKKGSIACNDPFLDVSDVTPPTGGLETGDRYVLVADLPTQEYVIQADTGGSALTQAAAGAAFDLVGRTPNGNTETGWSYFELDRSSVVSTLSAPIVALRLHDVVNTDGTENDPANNYEKWVVRILYHQKANPVLPSTGPVV